MNFKYAIYWLCFALSLSGFCQKIKPQRSTLGSSGSSATTNSSVYILQSIGQPSVIGSYNSQNKVVRQGFVQPFDLPNKKVNDQSLKMEIFPNPVYAGIMLRILDIIEERPIVQLVDINGRVVLKQSLENVQESSLDMTSFKAGIYFIEVRSGNKIGRMKLLKR